MNIAGAIVRARVKVWEIRRRNMASVICVVVVRAAFQAHNASTVGAHTFFTAVLVGLARASTNAFVSQRLLVCDAVITFVWAVVVIFASTTNIADAF